MAKQGSHLPTDAAHGHAPHLVIVDTYDGIREHLSDGPAWARAMLGLPVGDFAARGDMQVTVLGWDDWLRYELVAGSFLDWMPYPATRPVHGITRLPAAPGFPDMRFLRIPARDPATHRLLEAGLSPLSHGLLADSDPLFLMSYSLNQFLEELHLTQPISAVILPMFGGLGYVAQMSRATGAGLNDIAFGIVVTDTSWRRQASNGEGLWTRPAITRRQMEDLSLSLADVVFCFGPRGEALASKAHGRVVRAPRHVDGATLDAIARAAIAPGTPTALRFTTHAPLQGASGMLMLLDSARLLKERQLRLDFPICCGGTNMTFGPAKPRDFADYWGRRGWVRELVKEGYWSWPAALDTPEVLDVSLCVSLFDHLPDMWSELALGRFLLLSPAASEGFLPDAALPALGCLGEEPTADLVAERIAGLQSRGAKEIDLLRRELCDAVVRYAGSPEREQLLNDFRHGVADLAAHKHSRPRLAAAAQILLDRRAPPVRAAPKPVSKPDATLTVVVACYEMGDLVSETVRSIWRSSRLPNELILVDDGSSGAATAQAIARLSHDAATNGLPLSVIRQGNRGLAAARNRGLAEARGGYISFLDGDDLIQPDFYALALDILDANPELGGVAAWAEVFGDNLPDAFWNAPQPELPLLLVENTVIVPCMMPTDMLRSLGGYDERQRYNYEDWELAIRLLAAGRPIVTIPRYLQRYRVRGDSLLRSMSDVQNQVMREQLFARHRELCAAFAPELALQIEHRLFLRNDALAKAEGRSMRNAMTSRGRGRLRELLVRAGAAGRALLRRLS